MNTQNAIIDDMTDHPWECRDELAAAVRLQTQLIRGSVTLVYPDGRPIPAAERIAAVSPNHPPRSWDPRDL
jgi:hypothetical protein